MRLAGRHCGVVWFNLPGDVAAACWERLGVGPPVDIDGATRLVDRLACELPMGSTAKLEAMAAGEVPPGWDPTVVARRWMERPGLGWSCWATGTLYAALIAAGGTFDVNVLAARRVDPATVPVDFHCLVELRTGDRRWVVDPYFWVAPIEAPGGEAIRPGAWGQAFTEGPAWRTSVGACHGRCILQYRSVTVPLRPSDVEAFCRVSTTYSGVPNRPRLLRATTDGAIGATVDRDDAIRLRRWHCAPDQVWGAACTTEELADWPQAEARITRTTCSEPVGLGTRMWVAVERPAPGSDR